MKSYTDIEQSRKLAEILPLESADMKILSFGIDIKRRVVPINDIAVLNREDEISCWSLTALFNVLPDDCGIDKEDGKYVASYLISGECGAYTKTNPIDAVFEMIIKLHELKML